MNAWMCSWVLGRPYFTEENVEKEKGIIAQEIRMYEDNPYWRVYFNLLRGMYHDYPVRNDIAGTVESIYKIDKETLYECYRTFIIHQTWFYLWQGMWMLTRLLSKLMMFLLDSQ